MNGDKVMNEKFLETICVVDGKFSRLPLHNARMSATCREVFGNDSPALTLTEKDVPQDLRRGKVKCRVVYGREIERIEFERYTPRCVRTLKVVHADNPDYHLKYADRCHLEELRRQRGDADEVLIVRNGLVTDTSYSNLLFRVGGKLLTPAKPLLKGVMRGWLLEQGMIEECDIGEEMLLPDSGSGIGEVLMINAMLEPGTIPPIPLKHIIF